MTRWSAWPSPGRCATCWSTARVTSVDGRRSAGCLCVTPKPKWQRLADELLADIDKETVDFRDNYDGTTQEPTVLPAKLPNLLLNGQLGIAVGMATNIPPHNLSELVDADSRP